MRSPAINPHMTTCAHCGDRISAATQSPLCPKVAAQRKAEKLLGIERVIPDDNPETWDNGRTTKNGPNVIGAQTPQSGPNPYQGGAGMNSTANTHTSRAEGVAS